MRQSRLMSLVEAVANVVVGYGVAVLVQIVRVPAVRDRISLGRTCDRPGLHRGLDRAEPSGLRPRRRLLGSRQKQHRLHLSLMTTLPFDRPVSM